MLEKRTVDFDYQPQVAPFYDAVKQVLVQQPDYRGIGGHGLENHGRHGFHTQISIGTGLDVSRVTVNFRELKP